jgi:hypothetical protein
VTTTEQIQTSFREVFNTTFSETWAKEVTYLDCSHGNLYVWQASATYSDGSIYYHVQTPSFACIPNSFSGNIEPQCPPLFCDGGDCLCCNDC